MLAIPVWMLYELGILVARILTRNRKREDEEDLDVGSTLPLAAGATAATLPAAGGADDESASRDEPTEEPFRALSHDEMDDELARAEEEERRLNAGETGSVGEEDQTSTTDEDKGVDAEPEALSPAQRDDRNTSLQDPDRKD